MNVISRVNTGVCVRIAFPTTTPISSAILLFSRRRAAEIGNVDDNRRRRESLGNQRHRSSVSCSWRTRSARGTFSCVTVDDPRRPSSSRPCRAGTFDSLGQTGVMVSEPGACASSEFANELQKARQARHTGVGLAWIDGFGWHRKFFPVIGTSEFGITHQRLLSSPVPIELRLDAVDDRGRMPDMIMLMPTRVPITQRDPLGQWRQSSGPGGK